MPSITLPSGNTWAYVDANPAGTTTLLCLHGFPDLSYGYRHQIAPFARSHLSLRVVVPDMLGYGASSAPIDPARYTTRRLAADLAALLTALNIPKVVIVGHDWGSFAAGRFALWYPERVVGIVLMSVPYTPPARAPTSLFDVARRAPNLGYQLYLGSPSAAPTLEANLPYFLGLTYHPPDAPTHFTDAGALERLLASQNAHSDNASDVRTVLPPPVFATYLAAFRARGMTGPTNYYRTTRLRYEEEAPFTASGGSTGNGGESPRMTPLALPAVPLLAVYGTLDATIAPAALKAMRREVPASLLTEVPLEGVGHWVMLEGVGKAASDSLSSGPAAENVSDPLAPWRDSISAGAWRDKVWDGDGGAVGRAVIKWLGDAGIVGGGGVRGKL
ncbi:Alpha/Beta hydrolase protein [Mycena crocata]|nr:Alpha/Beta hydrolase protein [Mycena crocata]